MYWGVLGGSQDSTYRHIHGYDLLQWKDTTQNQQRKGTWDKIREKPDARLQESSPYKITQDVLNLSGLTWDRTCDVYKESSLVTWLPRWLLGAGHIGALASICQNPRFSEGKQFQHKTCYLQKKFRYGEPPLWRNAGNFAEIHLPRHQPRVNLWASPLEDPANSVC